MDLHDIENKIGPRSVGLIKSVLYLQLIVFFIFNQSKLSTVVNHTSILLARDEKKIKRVALFILITSIRFNLKPYFSLGLGPNRDKIRTSYFTCQQPRFQYISKIDQSELTTTIGIPSPVLKLFLLKFKTPVC